MSTCRDNTSGARTDAPHEVPHPAPNKVSGRVPAEQRVIGAVLRGGASRRMGRPKEGVQLPDGRTMLAAVIAALEPICDDVVLLGEPALEPGQECGSEDSPSSSTASFDRAKSWRVIPDRRRGLGPLAGIESLLLAYPQDTCVVCPCDMPRLTAGLIGRLLAAPDAPIAVFAASAGSAGPMSTMTAHGVGVFRPLPMRVDRRAVDAVCQSLDRGARALRELIASIPHVVIPIESEEIDRMMNINTPGDLPR